jgi:hypothetical protein
MKIDSSTVSMDSGRFYTQSTETTREVTSQSANGTGSSYSATTFLQTYAQYSGSSAVNAASKQYDSYVASQNAEDDSSSLVSDLYTNLAGSNITLVDARSAMEDFRKQLIERLEQFMERIKQQLLGRGNYNSQLQSLLGDNYSSYTQIQSLDSSIVNLTTSTTQVGTLWNISTSTTNKYSEAETTVFQSTGTVQTADGRNIDFNVSMEMSRSFMEESSTLTNQTQYILTDPLVIQLDDAPDVISDQKWFFDIDGDGTKEEISQLAKGNGLLALDENDNGIIDDGSELFGTKSGDGFKDLAAYDDDGNGWIDENDAVYTRLKIWTKDENGKDKLMDLQQADIGAIYLGAASTEYTHKTSDTNETQAVVRQTGFYLHESTGAAGTVQQIDFATKHSA